jgi:WD40 repeat protein
VGQASGDDTHNLTIQSLLEEKKAYDHSVNFERLGNQSREISEWGLLGKTIHGWLWLVAAWADARYNLQSRAFVMMNDTACVWIDTDFRLAPSKPTIVSTPTSSNLLAASVELWQKPRRDENGADADPAPSTRPFIISTGADRQMHMLETISGNEAITSFSGLSDSPVLSFVSILKGRYILMTNMSGHLLLQRGSEVLHNRKDHAKYAVKVVVHEELDKTGSAKVFWVATAGWDATVFLYRMTIPGDQVSTPVIGDPVARIKLATNPESLLFVRHVDTGELLLLVSRRDSSYIYYYQLESSLQGSTEQINGGNARSSPRECRLLGQQNLAPHSNAWVAFSPSHMALSPLDPGLLAVATSSEPHMKVIIVRLLFPSTTSPNPTVPDVAMTQATQALEALALQNREDAAILIQANTFAPQTSYSTPQVAWRPDGSGVWVNGDDGVVRGIEIKTGKVVALLKDGHEPGSKVRTIWAGYVAVPNNGDDAREEWVISGGFDKRLIVWKV